MSKYDVEMKYRLVKKAFTQLQLEYKHAGDHDTATCPETGQKTTIPRHKILDKYIVGSYYDFLIENGYNEADIKKAFKWN